MNQSKESRSTGSAQQGAPQASASNRNKVGTNYLLLQTRSGIPWRILVPVALAAIVGGAMFWLTLVR